MIDYISLPFPDFISVPVDKLISELKAYHATKLNEPASIEQITAWKQSILILQASVQELLDNHSDCSHCHVVLEYELPRERGRRPDALLLLNKSIVVVEFKGWANIQQSYVDQVAAYARDLQHYHEYSHELIFHPVLIMTSDKGINDWNDETAVLSSDQFSDWLERFWNTEKREPKQIEAEKWVHGGYLPLPSLVQAARMIFDHESLPSIRRAESAGIPQALSKLMQLAEAAKTNKEHCLALITGVPGAGKTLVGISFVYNYYTQNDGSAEAILLSGNGPLVEVLQYALKSSVFVRDVHGFLKTHGGHSIKVPREHIFIYDEAQRAWDKEKVMSNRGHDQSEPEDFLTIGAKKEWCLMIGLIGEGQEIYVGEESGIGQWNDAIATTEVKWRVTCPQKLKDVFTNAEVVDIADELNLTTSLRSHVAADVQQWVNYVLDGNIEQARKTYEVIGKQHFDIYITRNLLAAKQYVMDRYKEEPEKRFGLLASSKDRILPSYGIHNDFMSTKVVKKGPWYIDEKSSPFSCCQLTSVMTEFGCQGLELDFPILAWGDDFIWEGKQWQSNRITKGAQDSFQLRLNSYRVLLSRGRDGLIIYVPPYSAINNTYEIFISCGVKGF